jgi:DNA-directed RNA polymerase beta' subunit
MATAFHPESGIDATPRDVRGVWREMAAKLLKFTCKKCEQIIAYLAENAYLYSVKKKERVTSEII